MRGKKRNNSDQSVSSSLSMLLLELAAIIGIVVLCLGILGKFTKQSQPSSESDASTQQTTPIETQNQPETSPVPTTEESAPSLTESLETTPEPEETISSDSLASVPETEKAEEPSVPSEPLETLPTEEATPTVPVGTIYLTFDDGPSLQTTGKILDILKEKNVKATFFIVGYTVGSEKEQLVLREFNEGHTIGLHGTSHEYSKIYASLEALINNFDTLREKVFTTTGFYPTVIRFPGGSSNTVSKRYCQGIMTQAVEYFNNETDYTYFDWNIDSCDAGGVKSAEELYENVISGLKEGKDNIILMHDSSNKEYTVSALSAIIDYALSQGYEFKAISSNTPQVTHNIAN